MLGAAQLLRGESYEVLKLTQHLGSVAVCGVDAQRAEVVLWLEDKDQGSPPEHSSGETQALHQTRGEGEAALHAQVLPKHHHGPPGSHTHTHRRPNLHI